MRFGDIDGSCPEARRDRVMHAELKVGDGLVMLSEGSPDDQPGSGGVAVSVALGLNDTDETRRSFEGLAASGKTIQPLFEEVVRAAYLSWSAEPKDGGRGPAPTQRFLKIAPGYEPVSSAQSFAPRYAVCGDGL